MRKITSKNVLWIILPLALLPLLKLIPLELIQDVFRFVEKKLPSSYEAYLAAISSFAMVLITYFALRQNELQLVEMKKQRDDERKPKLHLSFVKKNRYFYLRIYNSGAYVAEDIGIEWPKEFISGHYCHFIENNLAYVSENPFCINPKESRYFTISHAHLGYWETTYYNIGADFEEYNFNEVNDWLNKVYKVKVTITYSYSNHSKPIIWKHSLCEFDQGKELNIQ